MLRLYCGSSAGHYARELTGLGDKIYEILGNDTIDPLQKIIKIVNLISPAIGKIGKIQRKTRYFNKHDSDKKDLDMICNVLSMFEQSKYGVNRSSKKDSPNADNIYLGVLLGSYYCINPISHFMGRNIPDEIQKEIELYLEIFKSLADNVSNIGTD